MSFFIYQVAVLVFLQPYRMLWIPERDLKWIGRHILQPDSKQLTGIPTPCVHLSIFTKIYKYIDVMQAQVTHVSAVQHTFIFFYCSKKKPKIADKILSQKVRQLVPESQAYMDLLAFERKLDATIARKRLDIQEALKRPMKVRFIRDCQMFLSNLFVNNSFVTLIY